jgi:hypothetical protein
VSARRTRREGKESNVLSEEEERRREKNSRAGCGHGDLYTHRLAFDPQGGAWLVGSGSHLRVRSNRVGKEGRQGQRGQKTRKHKVISGVVILSHSIARASVCACILGVSNALFSAMHRHNSQKHRQPSHNMSVPSEHERTQNNANFKHENRVQLVTDCTPLCLSLSLSICRRMNREGVPFFP